LFRHFGCTADFWERLVPRAFELDLARPLWYALRYSSLVLDTPVPASSVEALLRAAPPAAMRALMDALVLRALRPDHPSCGGLDVDASRFALYVRSHYLRMPLRLLLPH